MLSLFHLTVLSTCTVFVTIFSFLLVSATPLIPLAMKECGHSTSAYFTID